MIPSHLVVIDDYFEQDPAAFHSLTRAIDALSQEAGLQFSFSHQTEETLWQRDTYVDRTVHPQHGVVYVHGHYARINRQSSVRNENLIPATRLAKEREDLRLLIYIDRSTREDEYATPQLLAWCQANAGLDASRQVSVVPWNHLSLVMEARPHFMQYLKDYAALLEAGR